MEQNIDEFMKMMTEPEEPTQEPTQEVQPEAPVEPQEEPKVGELIAQLPPEFQGVAEQIRRVYQSKAAKSINEAKAPESSVDMSFLDSIINGETTADVPEPNADVWTDPYESKINALNAEVDRMKQAMVAQKQAADKKLFEEFVSQGSDKIRQLAADTGLEPTDTEVQDILTISAKSNLDINRAFGAILGEKLINTNKAARVTSKEIPIVDSTDPIKQFTGWMQQK